MILIGLSLAIVGIVVAMSYQRIRYKILGKRVPASIVGYRLLEENRHGDVYCFKVLYRDQGIIHKADSLETFTLPHGHYPYGHRNEYVQAYYQKNKPNQVIIADISYQETYCLILLLLAFVLLVLGLNSL